MTWRPEWMKEKGCLCKRFLIYSHLRKSSAAFSKQLSEVNNTRYLSVRYYALSSRVTGAKTDASNMRNHMLILWSACSSKGLQISVNSREFVGYYKRKTRGQRHCRTSLHLQTDHCPFTALSKCPCPALLKRLNYDFINKLSLSASL